MLYYDTHDRDEETLDEVCFILFDENQKLKYVERYNLYAPSIRIIYFKAFGAIANNDKEDIIITSYRLYLSSKDRLNKNDYTEFSNFNVSFFNE